MKQLLSIISLYLLFIGTSAMAAGGHEGHAGHDMGATAQQEHADADHSSMQHGGSHENGTYKHAAMAGDIHAEFQVMSLASMNMSDPQGRTHHVMVSFTKGGEKIHQAVGKIKLIAPSGKEQVDTLENFGSGVFAANFTIDEPGKWGVICLFKDSDGKHTVKFWYPHG